MNKRRLAVLALAICMALTLPACQRGSGEEKSTEHKETETVYQSSEHTGQRVVPTKPSESETESQTSKDTGGRTPIRRRQKTEASTLPAETTTAEESTTAPAETTQAASTTAASAPAETTPAAETTASETAPAGETEVTADVTEHSSHGTDEEDDIDDYTPIKIPEDFKPITVVDNDLVKLTVKSVEFEELWGYLLKVETVNKTEREFQVVWKNVSVNHYMADPYVLYTLKPEATDQRDISWFLYDLGGDFGFDEITDITFTFKLIEMSDASTAFEKEYTIYPMGQDKSRPMEKPSSPEGFTFFDNEYGMMILTALYDDDDKGLELEYYLQNNYDVNLSFEFLNVKVNGKDCDPFWRIECMPGKRAKGTVVWSRDLLKEAGVTTIADIELTIALQDPAEYPYKTLFEESYNIEAEYE